MALAFVAIVALVGLTIFAVGGGNALWQGTTNTLVRALKGMGAPPPVAVRTAAFSKISRGFDAPASVRPERGS